MVKIQEAFKEEHNKEIAELQQKLANINYFQQKKTEMELRREGLK